MLAARKKAVLFQEALTKRLIQPHTFVAKYERGKRRIGGAQRYSWAPDVSYRRRRPAMTVVATSRATTGIKIRTAPSSTNSITAAIMAINSATRMMRNGPNLAN
jgi:hypothetical protein